MYLLTLKQILGCPKLHRRYRRREIEEYEYFISTDSELTHLALIGYAKTGYWYCRGNLISDKHVLTSYECFDQNSKYDSIAFGEDQEIVFGIANVAFNGKSVTLITLNRLVR